MIEAMHMWNVHEKTFLHPFVMYSLYIIHPKLATFISTCGSIFNDFVHWNLENLSFGWVYVLPPLKLSLERMSSVLALYSKNGEVRWKKILPLICMHVWMKKKERVICTTIHEGIFDIIKLFLVEKCHISYYEWPQPSQPNNSITQGQGRKPNSSVFISSSHHAYFHPRSSSDPRTGNSPSSLTAQNFYYIPGRVPIKIPSQK